MGGGISVTGGAGGTEARYEDMLAAAARLDHAAAQVDDVLDVLRSELLHWQLGAAMTVDPAVAHALSGTLDGLAGVSGPLCAASDLHDCATRLRCAVASYESQDGGVAGAIGGFFKGVGSFVLAAGDGMEKLVTTLNPSTAFNTFLTDDPGMLDALATYSGLRVLEVLDAKLAPDGEPVVHDLGTDGRAAAVTPPRGVTDLMTELGLRNEGPSGSISVSFVSGADGRRRAIVDITGTKSWAVTETDDITSMVTNTRAIDGESTAYERGVLQAMTEAGVTAADQVMIVGHSQGGMVAVNAARRAVASGRFDVTHVVAAGAPLGRIADDLPRSVRLLALEDEHDDVPHLDGADNPDEPTQTTVTGGPDWNGILDDHNIDRTYRAIARRIDVSDDRSIRDFLDSAEGFFDDSSMTTHAYQITRTYH